MSLSCRWAPTPCHGALQPAPCGPDNVAACQSKRSNLRRAEPEDAWLAARLQPLLPQRPAADALCRAEQLQPRGADPIGERDEARLVRATLNAR